MSASGEKEFTSMKQPERRIEDGEGKDVKLGMIKKG